MSYDFEVFAPGPRKEGPSLQELYKDYKMWCEPLFRGAETVTDMETSTNKKIEEANNSEDLDQIMKNVQKCLTGRIVHRSAYGEAHGEENLDASHLHVITVLQKLWRRANVKKRRETSPDVPVVPDGSAGTTGTSGTTEKTGTTETTGTSGTSGTTSSVVTYRPMVTFFIQEADRVFEDEHKQAIRLVATSVSKDHDALCEAYGVNSKTEDEEAFFFVAACLVSGFVHLEGIDKDGPVTQFMYGHLMCIVRESFDDVSLLEKLRDWEWYRMFHSHVADRPTNGPILVMRMHAQIKLLSFFNPVTEDAIVAIRLTQSKSDTGPDTPKHQMRRNILRNILYFQTETLYQTIKHLSGVVKIPNIGSVIPVVVVSLPGPYGDPTTVQRGLLINYIFCVHRTLFQTLIIMLLSAVKDDFNASWSEVLDVVQKINGGVDKWRTRRFNNDTLKTTIGETQAARRFPVVAYACGDEGGVVDFFLRFYTEYSLFASGEKGLDCLINKKFFRGFIENRTRRSTIEVVLSGAYGPNEHYMTLLDYDEKTLTFALRKDDDDGNFGMSMMSRGTTHSRKTRYSSSI